MCTWSPLTCVDCNTRTYAEIVRIFFLRKSLIFEIFDDICLKNFKNCKHTDLSLSLSYTSPNVSYTNSNCVNIFLFLIQFLHLLPILPILYWIFYMNLITFKSFVFPLLFRCVYVLVYIMYLCLLFDYVVDFYVNWKESIPHTLCMRERAFAFTR